MINDIFYHNISHYKRNERNDINIRNTYSFIFRYFTSNIMDMDMETTNGGKQKCNIKKNDHSHKATV